MLLNIINKNKALKITAIIFLFLENRTFISEYNLPTLNPIKTTPREFLIHLFIGNKNTPKIIDNQFRVIPNLEEGSNTENKFIIIPNNRT